MNIIYYLGAFLFAPLVTWAHDGEHVSTAWYQESSTLLIAAAGFVALTGLVYGVLHKQKTLIVAPATLLIALLVFSVVGLSQDAIDHTSKLAVADFGAGQTVTLHKSPNCGCCTGHAAALEAAGFAVTIKETADLAAIKDQYAIPSEGESCHTSIIGDYVVEGHVPLEAIEVLLAEQPDIAGIGLAGMPIGTPGMPGAKTAPYEVYQLSDTAVLSSYLTI
jgi:hypothetical protein